MLASAPSQHLESDCPPSRNPKCESTSKNHALIRQPPAGSRLICRALWNGGAPLRRHL
jgi:hypothetical protein